MAKYLTNSTTMRYWILIKYLTNYTTIRYWTLLVNIIWRKIWHKYDINMKQYITQIWHKICHKHDTIWDNIWNICRFVYLHFCLFVFLSFCLFVFLTFCLFVFLSFCLFVFLSFCLLRTEETHLAQKVVTLGAGGGYNSPLIASWLSLCWSFWGKQKLYFLFFP